MAEKSTGQIDYDSDMGHPAVWSRDIDPGLNEDLKDYDFGLDKLTRVGLENEHRQPLAEENAEQPKCSQTEADHSLACIRLRPSEGHHS